MLWRIVAAVLALLTIASVSNAGRKLQIFSDAALTNTSLDDDSPRVVNLHVVDIGSFHATGVRFSTEPTAGFTGVWLSDATSYWTNGSSPTDIAVAYGACLSPPVLILTISYQLFGTSECSELRIVPPDGWSCVLSPDTGCAFIEHCILELGNLRVNCPVATQPTTWGKVKALYRN